ANSSGSSAAASPVDPATTSPWVPPSSCARTSRRHAPRSMAPLASNGVASAVMLPEICKVDGPGWTERRGAVLPGAALPRDVPRDGTAFCAALPTPGVLGAAGGGHGILAASVAGCAKAAPL